MPGHGGTPGPMLAPLTSSVNVRYSVKMSLTRKQREILDFLEEFIRSQAHAPTIQEIANHFGYSSKATVHEHLTALKAKGFIERERYAHAGIALRPDEVPLLGRVAAGKPIEVIEQMESLEVPERMRKGQGSFFALQVSGDSMQGEGILDGDYVVVRKAETARSGQIVVAMVDNEATIKRFFKKSGQIELHSANEKYAPFIVKPHQEFKIAGLYCGLLRY